MSKQRQRASLFWSVSNGSACSFHAGPLKPAPVSSEPSLQLRHCTAQARGLGRYSDSGAESSKELSCSLKTAELSTGSRCGGHRSRISSVPPAAKPTWKPSWLTQKHHLTVPVATTHQQAHQFCRAAASVVPEQSRGAGADAPTQKRSGCQLGEASNSLQTRDVACQLVLSQVWKSLEVKDGGSDVGTCWRRRPPCTAPPLKMIKSW